MKPQLINLVYAFSEPFMIKELVVPYFTNTHHFHNDYELVFVLESTGKRVIGDHVGNFKKGDMVFVGPNLPHAWFNDKEYYNGQETFYARSIVSYFKSTWLSGLLQSLPQVSKLDKVLEYAKRGIKVEGEAHKRIAKILINHAGSVGLQESIDMLSILHELAENDNYQLLASVRYTNQSSVNEAQRINQVYEYVMKHFSSNIRLDEIAEIAHMSPNAFCRYFKSQTQKNFSQFVNEVRVGHARKLLYNKDITVAQVCYESGFQSVTNFNKFFKRFTQQTPIEYRKELNRVH